MKKRFIVIMSMAIFIIFLGFIIVSNNTPKFIKNNSPFKIYVTVKPFDFRVETKNYLFYVNKKTSENIKTGTYKLYDNLSNKVTYITDKLQDTSKIIELNLKEILKSMPVLNIISEPITEHNY